MKRAKKGPGGLDKAAVRCGIYTRKSTEEGLDQEFNSLDAQRESAEAYIKSQAPEGWTCLPEPYNDGGFSGGNMDRPALKRLLKDMQAGKIDCVIVYKVDRLSRSLLDFAKMMETFDKHQVSFVSVTQQFHTATSMGRLVLNVLLSFAQFEREIISERTRDKIAAARRKGKWSGGHPLLGYDVDPRGSKLIVNPEEAERVRDIFALYLRHQGLIPVVQELERQGGLTKHWVTRQGRSRGGRPFTKTALYRLLTNVAYVGQIKYKAEVHRGEHPAIVERALWQETQALLQRNGKVKEPTKGKALGALLQGLLRCVPCGCAMTPSYAAKQGNKRYRYYVCSGAQKRGWKTCPSQSLPAEQIERFVVEQIRALAQDPERLGKMLNEIQFSGAVADEKAQSKTTLELETQNRLSSIVDERWEALTTPEQCLALQTLVERVHYDGASNNVSLTFQVSGLEVLWATLRQASQETLA
jgi:site-specific DNA recombinase